MAKVLYHHDNLFQGIFFCMLSDFKIYLFFNTFFAVTVYIQSYFVLVSDIHHSGYTIIYFIGKMIYIFIKIVAIVCNNLWATDPRE